MTTIDPRYEQHPDHPDPIRVRVHYPAGESRLVLRTDLDWDHDVEPVEEDPEASTRAFEIRTEQPFLYFKSVLVTEDGETWSCGPNRLATNGAERPADVFPFFKPSGAQLTDLEHVDSPQGTWACRIFLPPGYDENTLHRYPVLYMNDGHNLFHPEEAATGKEWGVQETLEQLDRMTSIEQVIAVGVYPGDRMHDYGSAGLEAYRTFLADTLVPHIDQRYRTLEGARHTAILGSSLGGVAALDAAWHRPDRFGMAGCLSTTFGYDDDLRAAILSGPRPDIRVYLDSGWPRDNFEVTRDIRACLVRAGFEEGTDLLYFAFPGASHGESDWGDRAHLPFQFFFGHRPDQRSDAGVHQARSNLRVDRSTRASAPAPDADGNDVSAN